MTKWVRTLVLDDIWKEHEYLGAKEMAKLVAVRLEALEEFGSSILDNQKKKLIKQFHRLSKKENASFDDFDNVMDHLYDWADTYIGSWRERGNEYELCKACWIKTF